MSSNEISIKVKHDQQMFNYIPIIRKFKHLSINVVKYRIENSEPVITCDDNDREVLIQLYQTLLELQEDGAQFEIIHKNISIDLNRLKRMISTYLVQVEKDGDILVEKD